MKHVFSFLTTSLVLTCATMLAGQAPPADKAETRARTEAKNAEGDVSYGRIKELTAASKVVIDIDDAPDKSFDLKDKDLTVKLGKDLKVGDPVKVTEHSALGKTKSVTIMKHAGGGVTHGDKDPHKK
ncbi:MAG TPA: hypothetical protein VEX68_22295 [Bryobacteraceae bacterium]|nr:hypothetical protein [Bryobacteraceae bacterium]